MGNHRQLVPVFAISGSCRPLTDRPTGASANFFSMGYDLCDKVEGYRSCENCRLDFRSMVMSITDVAYLHAEMCELELGFLGKQLPCFSSHPAAIPFFIPF